MKCIICEKELKAENYLDSPIPESINHEAIALGEANPEMLLWYDGTVDIICPGYGSDFDTERLRICLCDDCLRAKVEAGLIQRAGNYI